jgi:hypothetical protein
MEFNEFADNYIRIIAPNGSSQKLDETHLKAIKEHQLMISKGYEVRLLKGRSGNRLIWTKINK